MLFLRHGDFVIDFFDLLLAYDLEFACIDMAIFDVGIALNSFDN